MQALHKIKTFSAQSGIRSADVLLNLDRSLFHVRYSNDCQLDAFSSQERAESAARQFVDKKEHHAA